jgi:site-specific DNA recombinase
LPTTAKLACPTCEQVYRDKVERLTDAFGNTEEGREAHAIIRSLIQEIRLIPSDGALTIELRGDLAGILAFSQAARDVSPPTDRALQIKMVAGAGFGRKHAPIEFLMVG